MDWYAWLSKSGLDPTLVYQYTVLFSSNELDVDDVPHFDHQFLQSMGISTAKHRLEILKLANKENQKKKKRVVGSRHPLATLLAAMRETRRCLAKYVRVSAHCDNSVAIMAVVPRRNMPKRNRRLVGLKQVKKLMITKSSKGDDDDDGWGSLFRDLRPT